MPDDFPAAIRQFIAEHIQSLAQLEGLLLLRGSAERQWQAAEVAKALYTTADGCAAQLTHLARHGLVKATPPPDVRFQYGPASDDLDRLVGELAVVYQERRVTVITLIYSKPAGNVQAFADAFRLRKEN